jgi:hypothetical protein
MVDGGIRRDPDLHCLVGWSKSLSAAGYFISSALPVGPASPLPLSRAVRSASATIGARCSPPAARIHIPSSSTRSPRFFLRQSSSPAVTTFEAKDLELPPTCSSPSDLQGSLTSSSSSPRTLDIWRETTARTNETPRACRTSLPTIPTPRLPHTQWLGSPPSGRP